MLAAQARAKINLTLDVLGKRPDGYHEIETVMQSIELCDQMEFYPAEEKITLSVEGNSVPAGPGNLVYRAAERLREFSGKKAGVRIRLVKNIPVEAGLGGGSADAAVTLAALNELWEIGLSLSELTALGGQLGSDVPFGLLGGTVLARGRGERLEQLPPCPQLGLVLIKPPFGLSTSSVYRAYTAGGSAKKPDNLAMIRAVKEKDLAGIAGNLANVLERTAVAMHPVIGEIKSKLIEAGAMAALMSGSGPTVFGLALDLESAREIASRYNRTDELVLVSRTFNEAAKKN